MAGAAVYVDLGNDDHDDDVVCVLRKEQQAECGAAVSAARLT